LAQANIAAFVDSNPSSQGRSLANHKILSPAQLAARTETILVCSKTFEGEIMQIIRKQLMLSNPVILLYS
jgi:hypothetical protein